MNKYIIFIVFLCLSNPILLSAKKQKTWARLIKDTVHNMWYHNGIKGHNDEKELWKQLNKARNDTNNHDTNWKRHLSVRNVLICAVCVLTGVPDPFQYVSSCFCKSKEIPDSTKSKEMSFLTLVQKMNAPYAEYILPPLEKQSIRRKQRSEIF